MNPPKLDRPAFIQLGRFGDLILLLPAWKHYADLWGRPVDVVVAELFASVLDGVSYVRQRKLNVNWFNDLNRAITIAGMRFPTICVTQLMGKDLHQPPDDLPSYSLSMWNRTGLTIEDYSKLPLVFDKRDHAREFALFNQLRQGDRRQFVLVNFKGTTSPFPYAAEILNQLTPLCQRRHRIVDLATIKLKKLYDFLGLYDRALGLITTDTSTLHLAAASPVPYIALLRGDGQSGSVPKGNCVLQVKYDEIEKRMEEIKATFAGWLKPKSEKEPEHAVEPVT